MDGRDNSPAMTRFGEPALAGAIHQGSALPASVWEKSSPLYNSGSPVALASA
jgi:hypothetical protein